jgi:hypothetical protein
LVEEGLIVEHFALKHYHGDTWPSLKGNGFDGLVIADEREVVQEFIDTVNRLIDENADLKRRLGGTQHA